MFQRCTDKARDVVGFAVQEASAAKQRSAGSCELFLGLLREPAHAAGHMLTDLALPPNLIEPVVRERIRPGGVRPDESMETIGPSTSEATVNALLAPGGRRILDVAWDEAQLLGCTYVGTEHLLIALVSDAKLLPGRILQEMGLDLDMARESAAKWLGADTNPPTLLEAPSSDPPSRDAGSREK
ncbi:MAG TPA: Clp protease N-terminal domain-containing protein [Capsulimonadaceae bacterium]|nr:Clp protease N-terminal domain-containing protein [Capsulimonadaceae bacterium]